MQQWPKVSQDRLIQVLTDYWPTAMRTREGSLRTETMTRWLDELQGFECRLVLHVLGEIKAGEQKDYLPPLGTVRDKCAAVLRRQKDREANQKRGEEPVDVVPPQAFAAEDSAWWRGRCNLPGWEGAWYRKARERLAAGKLPLVGDPVEVGAREPGEEG